MKDIKIVEVNMSANKHSMFNAAFLSMVSSIKSCNHITFFSEKSHQICVQEFLKNNKVVNKINYVEVKAVDKGGFMLPVKFFFESYTIFKILLKYRKEDYLLILTSLSTVSNFIVKVIKLFFPKTKLAFIIHGELEFIKPQKLFMHRLLGFFLKLSFKIKTDKNTTYFVLGDVIKSNMIKYKIVNLDKVLSIDHPCLFVDAPNKIKKSTILKLGAIGVASELKNSHFIFKIADKITENNISNIQLEIIGKLLPNMNKFLKPNVNYFKGNEMIVQEVFEKKIAELDFALFFYDNKYYELCASGAFFDALNYEIPILGLKNDFFDYYFEKYGALGYLFENIEDLIEFLINYDHLSLIEYDVFLMNIKFAKKQLSIDNLAIQFEKELKDFVLFN